MVSRLGCWPISTFVAPPTGRGGTPIILWFEGNREWDFMFSLCLTIVFVDLLKMKTYFYFIILMHIINIEGKHIIDIIIIDNIGKMSFSQIKL